MRKTFVCFLVMMLVIICFTSCEIVNELFGKSPDSNDTTTEQGNEVEENTEIEHKHTFGEWHYDEISHWCSWNCSLDACDIDTYGEHYDKDSNGYCDACEYQMIHTEHTGEWKWNEESHSYQYTCGCITEEIAELHYDHDIDSYCDACGYKLSGENTDTYSFEELFGISDYIDINDISKVIIDYCNGSIGRPILHDVFISTDENYIASVVDFISNASFTRATDSYDGVGVYDVILADDSRTFEFSFTSRDEFYVNGICYNSTEKFPLTGRFDDGYEYIETFSDVYVSSYGSEFILPFDISEIHLRRFEVDFFAYDFTKDADLIVDGQIIRVQSAKTIYWEGKGWFEVVSERDFSSIIPAGETKSLITFVDESCKERGLVFVSNNVIYTKDEIEKFADRFTSAYSYEILNGDGTTFVDRAFVCNETLTIKIGELNLDD